MAREFTELLKILFPEYQIKESVDERGFIAKKQEKINYADTQRQAVRQNGSIQQSVGVNSSVRMETPQVKPQNTAEKYVPEKKVEKVVNRAADVFDTLPGELKKYWVGSQNDMVRICKSFQRPYVKGFGNTKPKNSILILGTESRGKIYAVRCVSNLLKQHKVFRYEEVSVIDMKSYASDSGNT